MKKCKYRIWTSNNRVKYAGTDLPSWLSLEQAKKLVNYLAGEQIYEYDNNGNKLWEVL
jgi:hypothetical protein